jgi:predicted enzyme related to lactoylglutathione lyase
MFKDSPAFSGFSTNNIQQAKDFYHTILGVDTREENGMLTLHLSTGGEVLIYFKPNHEPATYTVLNFVVENIEKTVNELVQKGVSFERYDGLEQDELGIMHGEPLIAWFKDPAGNILAVLEDKTIK